MQYLCTYCTWMLYLKFQQYRTKKEIATAQHFRFSNKWQFIRLKTGFLLYLTNFSHLLHVIFHAYSLASHTWIQPRARIHMMHVRNGWKKSQSSTPKWHNYETMPSHIPLTNLLLHDRRVFSYRTFGLKLFMQSKLSISDNAIYVL